jgi:hypothetical protein
MDVADPLPRGGVDPRPNADQPARRNLGLLKIRHDDVIASNGVHPGLEVGW